MQNSQLNSLTVPEVGSQNPSTVFKAADIPIRLVIDNVGPNMILLAHDTGTLSDAPAFANVYRLRPDQQLVVVLAPKQGIFAVSIGGGGQLSLAASESLPIT